MAKSWFDRLIGDPTVVPLRHLILNLVILLAVVALSFFFIADMLVSFSWFRLAFNVAMLTLFAGLGTLVRVKRLYREGNALASISGQIYLVTNFFANAGSDGSSWMVTMVVLAVLAILHEPRAAWLWALATVALLVLCLVVEAVHPEWVLPYRTHSDELFDLVFTFVFCAAMMFPLILLVMRFYGESNERTRVALARSAQTEKLAALGETMASLNHEISNPLGILDLSLTTAETWWSQEFPQAVRLLRRLPQGQGESYGGFLLAGSGELPASDRSSRHDRARRYQELLTALGWDDPQPFADQLADYFSGDWEASWEGWLKCPAGPELLQAGLRFLDMVHSYRTASSAHARLMALVSSMAHYSRAEDGGGGAVPIRLAESLDLVLALFVGHRNKAIEVVRNYTDGPPVWGRPDELLQVWTNLVKNALSAMHDQGTLTVSLSWESGMAVVTIDDSGPGVPEELRSKIFQPFFTTKGQGKGTGLGLPIVRRIVVEHGGSLSLGSSPGGGARFTVRLPSSPASTR